MNNQGLKVRSLLEWSPCLSLRLKETVSRGTHFVCLLLIKVTPFIFLGYNFASLQILNCPKYIVFFHFLHLFALLGLLTDQNNSFPYLRTLSYTSTSKIPPFHTPEAWKMYPIWAEPSRIGHYGEYLPNLQGELWLIKIRKIFKIF